MSYQYNELVSFLDSPAVIAAVSEADNETSIIPVAALAVSKLNVSVVVADNASGRIWPRKV